MSRAYRHTIVLAIALLLVALTVSAAACGGSTTDGGGTAGGGDVVLTVAGFDGTKEYTIDQLRSLPSTEGYGGIKSSTGRITTPMMMKGVLLEDLFAEVGGLAEDVAVGIIAKDGYEMTMSATQLRSGDFITYDMVTGAEITVDEPLRVLIAYEYEGKPIDPVADGPLRLALITSGKNQVTDGHWSVKWVNKVQAKAIVEEWTLSLKGYLAEEMDRATFESGAAEGCHGSDWTDADGNRWTGIPLYLLVGRVDDDVSHNGPAYNRNLAEAGYPVKLSSAGGASVEVDSKTMYYKRDILIAYKLNGEALPDEYWPLRLVGEGLPADGMIGQITQIEAILPAQ